MNNTNIMDRGGDRGLPDRGNIVAQLQDIISPPIINPSTGQPYPRFGPYVDLGIIDAIDVLSAGFIELIPFAPGRVIEEVYFMPDGYVQLNGDWDVHFVTPNTIIAAPDLGLCTVIPSNVVQDSIGLQISSSAPNLGFGTIPSSTVRFRDCGPLSIASHQTASRYGAWRTWARNTAFALQETVFKNNCQFFVTTNGVTGSSEPVWNPASPPADGTVQWGVNSTNLTTKGSFHVRAIVSDSPGIITPPRIGSVRFIQQPTNVVSGATITPAVTVQVLDTDGNPYTMLQVFVELFILGEGTLTGGGQQSINATTGIATFSGLSIAEVHTGCVLRAYADYGVNIPPVDSNAFNVT